MFFRKALFLLAILFCVEGNAQSYRDTLLQQANHFAHLANSLFESAPNQAVSSGIEAIAFYQQLVLVEEEIDVRNGLSYIYFNIVKDYTSLLDNATIAYDLARKYLKPENPKYFAAANNYALYIEGNLRGDFRKERTLYHELLQIEFTAVQHAILYYNLASRYFILGDFETALDNYKFARNNYLESGGAYTSKIQEASIEIGRCYLQLGKLEPAIEQFEEVITETESTSLFTALRSAFYLADALYIKGATNEALVHLMKIITNPEFRSKDWYWDAWHSFGRIHQYDRSLKLQQALDTLSRVPENLDPVKLARYKQLRAESLWYEEHYREAFTELDLAIDLLYPSFQERSDFLEYDLMTSCPAPYELSIALNTKAQWLTNQGGSTNLLEAVHIYHLLSRLRDQLRAEFPNLYTRLTLVGNTRSYHESALAIIYRISIEFPQEAWMNSALEIMERSKSSLLLDYWQQRKKLQEAGGDMVVMDSLEKEAMLARRLLAQTTNPIDHLEFERKIIKLQEDVVQQRNLLRVEYGILLKSDILALMDLPAIRGDLIESNDLYVHTFSGEESLYILHITKNECHLSKYPISNFSRPRIDDFINSLSLRSTQKPVFDSLGNYFYNHLIAPGLTNQSVSNITVFPDGALELLPYSALLTSPLKGLNIGEYPYLIKKFEIKIAYSASILDLQSEELPENNEVLGVYPLFEGTKRHTSSIAENLDFFSSFTGQQLVAEEANKSNFLAALNDQPFGMIFIGTHASANEENSSEPLVSFNQEDVPLSALAGLNLRVNSVVFAACEVNRGRLYKGEGIFSISRAFAYSGVPHAITTLWSVDEPSTVQILKYYLLGLQAGDSKSKAIRDAQLAYLSSEDVALSAKTPLQWAGLISIGNNNNLLLSKQSTPYSQLWFYLKSLSLISFIGMVVYFFRQRQQRSIYKKQL